jgi:hypothetical protein
MLPNIFAVFLECPRRSHPTPVSVTEVVFQRIDGEVISAYFIENHDVEPRGRRAFVIELPNLETAFVRTAAQHLVN